MHVFVSYKTKRCVATSYCQVLFRSTSHTHPVRKRRSATNLIDLFLDDHSSRCVHVDLNLMRIAY